MKFLSAYHTDVGIRKKTNQDSILIKEAETAYGNVLLAVICDGMGGLSKGELASAELIRAYDNWFENAFPHMLYHDRGAYGIDRTVLEASLNGVAQDVNYRVGEHAAQHQSKMGTTVVILLLAEGRYYLMNVGDSRIYRLDARTMVQMTKDQTYVQREVDDGRMTPEEARIHPRRNVLLQCVGAGQTVIPEFGQGICRTDDLYLLCSDGFRHVITEEEFCQRFAPEKMTDEQSMQEALADCTELAKSRNEKDNISALLIRVCGE